MEHQSEKIYHVGTRMEHLESNSKKQEKANKRKFEAIRKEIVANNTNLEEKVTENIKQVFGPKIQD